MPTKPTTTTTTPQKGSPQTKRVLPDAHLRAPRVVTAAANARVGAGGAGVGVAGRGPRSQPLPVHDIRQTKEYKAAARKWLSTIVALPILMYTSYILYERTFGNQKPKRLVGGDGRVKHDQGLLVAQSSSSSSEVVEAERRHE
ncbi:uncharacterized protein BP01DRAFT_354521 [Aspergillus saccharolyticus JOP 1030-1]|uniref:Uncharacterized protein n=1 Tax=Aspergillus saccharolyticus JOP 1030-1 TaxID=1450539 RepID=A0A318ZKM3_9EURO|nr:hypothetical protein BP01DRAFT_354521 [Aspergillus saccharolyticus JOP 1030-1]PYH47325.1 hypothetical protein BP01DRAFT_354521 [Aspergillus saccharolyticus JOP 1030-1]